MQQFDSISIIIPTYNQDSYLRDAIESAQALDYPNLEIVVADDASTDETEKVANRYASDARVKYHRNHKNLGRVANYRFALSTYASGRWVLNLDGDDFLTDRSFLKDSMEVLAQYQNVVLVAAGETDLKPDGSRIQHVLTDKPTEFVSGEEFFLKWLSKSGGLCHLGSLYNRNVALQIGFYVHNILSSDWESLRRLVLMGNVLLLGRSVGVWRGHGANATLKYDVNERLENLLSLTGPYEFAKRRNVDSRRLEKWRKNSLRDYLVSEFNYFAAGGFGGKAISFVKGSLNMYPELTAPFFSDMARKPASAISVVLSIILGQQAYIRLKRIKDKVLKK